jgi:hypothetical protein
MSRTNENGRLQLLLGIGEIFVVDVAIACFLILSVKLGIGIILYVAGYAIGVTQIIYLIPRFILLGRQRRWDRAKGIIIRAVIVALLNGIGCYWFLSHISR